MNIIPTSMKGIIRNSFSTVLVRGTFGFARILVLMVLAKIFGAKEFGLFSLILIFIEITKVVSDLGVDIVIIRRFAADPKNAHSILDSTLGLKIIAAAIGSVLVIILYALLYNDVYGLSMLSIGCISIFTSLSLNAFVSYYQAQLSMGKIIGAHIIGYGCYLTLSLAAIFQRTSLLLIIAIMPLTEGIILFLLVRRYRAHYPLRINVNIAFIKSLLSESIYVGLGGIAVVIYMRLDSVMISRLLDLKSVGQYAFAYRLTEPFSLLFTSFGVSLYATLSALPDKSKVRERFSFAKKYLFGMITIACISIAGYAFIIRPILPSFSSEYIESGKVLVILSFVLLFKALNNQMTAIMNSMKKFRMVSIITFTNLITSFMLNIAFISRYGIQGAAIAVVGTEFVNSLLQSGSLLYYDKVGE